jgi:hypothetical protein
VEAAEHLRSLVSKIVLTPEDGRLVIDVHGAPAGILGIAHGTAPPARTDGAVTRAKLNAGRHGQNSLPKPKGRPWGTADGAEMLSKQNWLRGSATSFTCYSARPRKRP